MALLSDLGFDALSSLSLRTAKHVRLNRVLQFGTFPLRTLLGLVYIAEVALLEQTFDLVGWLFFATLAALMFASCDAQDVLVESLSVYAVAFVCAVALLFLVLLWRKRDRS